jgi:hypothetical protein
MAATLKQGVHPLTPFHWEIEFPEVFVRKTPGFNVVVGNPPFAGKNTIIAGHRTHYLPWLQTLHVGAHGNSDLVAPFFRRAFTLIGEQGVIGLIATNTVGQGDTRETGLATLLKQQGTILRAIRRFKWPGEAAVTVSVVHVSKGTVGSPVLDGRVVRRISAYLVEGDLDRSPERLTANTGKAFVGSYVLGLGFTFSDEAAAKGTALSTEEMKKLVKDNNQNAERIFPYINGDEVNSRPDHAYNRYVIDFFDRPLGRRGELKSWNKLTEREKAECRTTGLVPLDYPDEVAEDWPDLIGIVRRLAKPERDRQNRAALRQRWWQYAEKRPGLYRTIQGLDRVLVRSLTSAHFSTFTYLPTKIVYDQTLIVFAVSDHATFCCVASSIHETWARFMGATLEDRGRYNLEDCFDTFPFPGRSETCVSLENAGRAYQHHRAALMVARNEGMTKTYNRFHDPIETAEDIRRLRELHAAMDRAVLEPMAGTTSPHAPRRFSSTRRTRTTTPTRAACSGPPTSATRCSAASSRSTPSATPRRSASASHRG